MAASILPPLVPTGAAIPDVLPTARVKAGGRLVSDLRASLRKIDDARNVLTVIGVWGQVVATAIVAVTVGHWLVWILAVLFMGRIFANMLILAHESVHRLLFTNPAVNDFVGRWLFAYPGFTPFELYRRGHLAHHKDEMGPEEPDYMLYAVYPVERASLRRKLIRDAVGISGYKNLVPLIRALRKESSRAAALRIFAAQFVLLGITIVFGHPEVYLLLWLLPWLTVWRVINRLRAIAEHGGMTRSKDRRQTTHHVRQSWLARFWMTPFHTGWHLAHHVDIGIPWRNLPALHEELVAAGWVTEDYTYPNYRALWKQMVSDVEWTAPPQAEKEHATAR